MTVGASTILRHGENFLPYLNMIHLNECDAQISMNVMHKGIILYALLYMAIVIRMHTWHWSRPD